MLVQITNSCSMGCSHCLSDALPNANMHMSMEMADATIKFIHKIGIRAINISGGEPSEHPQFIEIVEKFAKEFPANKGFIVAIISNGTFIFDKDKSEALKKLFLNNDCLKMQICTHKDYYPRYQEIVDKTDEFKKIDKFVALAFNPSIYLHQLGRCANSEELCKKAIEHPYTTSCLMTAVMCWQLPFSEAIRIHESRGHFCTPLIDWQGNIHLSESWLCPNIGNITTFDRFNDIIKFKPCSKCKDYQKIFKVDSKNYKQVIEMMNLK